MYLQSVAQNHTPKKSGDIQHTHTVIFAYNVIYPDKASAIGEMFTQPPTTIDFPLLFGSLLLFPSIEITVTFFL